jgi:hypothetical protein
LEWSPPVTPVRVVGGRKDRGGPLCPQQVQVEPPTPDLLLNKYTDPETCILFPKTPTTDARRRAIEASHQLIILAPDAPYNAATVALAQAEFARSLEYAEQQPGLRVDLRIVGPDGTEIWLDVSGVHTTATAHRQSTYDHVMADAPEAIGDATNGKHLPCTPALVARETEKKEKCAPMVAVAHIQANSGERLSRPTFLPFVFSSDGELSKGAFETIEWLAMQVKARSARNGPERDGASIKQMAARFRTAIKDSVMCAIARGVGRQMRVGGFPLGTQRPNGDAGGRR